MADQNTFFGSDIKVYTTQIAIENGPTGLLPGMSAMVEIHVSQIPDVLSRARPVALSRFKGKDYLYRQERESASSTAARSPLGTSNDKLIEIKKGLKEGELRSP